MATSKLSLAFQKFEKDLVKLIRCTVKHGKALYGDNPNQAESIDSLNVYLDSLSGENVDTSEKSRSPAIDGSLLASSENLPDTNEAGSGKIVPAKVGIKRKKINSVNRLIKNYPSIQKRCKLGPTMSKNALAKRQKKMPPGITSNEQTGDVVLIEATELGDSALDRSENEPPETTACESNPVSQNVSYLLSDGSESNEPKPCPVCEAPVMHVLPHIRRKHLDLCHFVCRGCKRAHLLQVNLRKHVLGQQQCFRKYISETGCVVNGKPIIRLQVPRYGFGIGKIENNTVLESFTDNDRKRKYVNISYEECSLCRQIIVESMHMHIRRLHGSEGLLFECEKCKKRFESHDAYLVHAKMSKVCFAAESSFQLKMEAL